VFCSAKRGGEPGEAPSVASDFTPQQSNSKHLQGQALLLVTRRRPVSPPPLPSALTVSTDIAHLWGSRVCQHTDSRNVGVQMSVTASCLLYVCNKYVHTCRRCKPEIPSQIPSLCELRGVWKIESKEPGPSFPQHAVDDDV
jgi:hypothetical protein